MKIPIKKILIFIGFLAIAFAIGYAIYYFFFKPTPRASVPYIAPPQVLVPGGLPEITNENINRQIIEEEFAGLPSIERVPKGTVISDKARGGYTRVKDELSYGTSPTIRSDGSLAYYDSSSGRFYKINPDGTKTLLTSQRFYSVSKINWSDDAGKAVLEYPDGSNILYDFNQEKQFTLPKEMQDFDFSDNGQMIAAEVIAEQEESNWIVTSNPDGTNVQFIERVGSEAENVDINISPNNQVVATFRDNINANSQQVLLIGQHGENFKSITTNGRGFEGQWTPDGQKMLYSVYNSNNNFNPTLWIVNASGDYIGTGNTNIGLQTWSDKCTISSNSSTAYCAVPQELPLGSGWYPELASGLPDTFYEIDLNSGQVNLLAEPVGSQQYYSASSVFLSPDEQTLYFQDGSGAVYSISL